MTNTETLTIAQLIKAELPPLPGSVARITSMLHDMRVSRSMIADAISLDPVLSTRILRLANSSAYSQQREVTSVSAAIAAVGNRAISDILLVSGVGDSFGRKVLTSPTGRNVWLHSLATGTIASDLCRLARLKNAEDAFSCGLLLDLGQLIMLRADSEFYPTVVDNVPPSEDVCAIERAVYGFDHAELGYYAAESWQLPEHICQMIKYHHRPVDTIDESEIIAMLSIADQLVSLRQSFEEIDELVESDVVRSYGFTEFQLDHVWDGMIDRVTEMMQMT